MSLDDPGSARISEAPPPRSDKHPLNWLLLLPLLATLIPAFYNRIEPTLLGIPFFYWYQLAAISIGVITTLIVYRVSRR
jgi:uncharacterized membrane protein (DUF441 family)